MLCHRLQGPIQTEIRKGNRSHLTPLLGSQLKGMVLSPLLASVVCFMKFSNMCHQILVKLENIRKGRPFRNSGWLYLIHPRIRVENFLFEELAFPPTPPNILFWGGDSWLLKLWNLMLFSEGVFKMLGSQLYMNVYPNPNAPSLLSQAQLSIILHSGTLIIYTYF